MSTSIFEKNASDYADRALVQANASQYLLKLADLKGNENILDLGCGPGHLTKFLRENTTGKIYGADPSVAMIKLAKDQNISDCEFVVSSAEELDFKGLFDVVFTNSAFQWFTDPDRAIKNCYTALKEKGRIVMQAPGGKEYCPAFVEIENKAKSDPDTKQTFANFRNPWLFRDTAEEYASLFEHAGFTVYKAEIIETAMDLTIQQCLKVFQSGAGEAYLNEDYYTSGFSDEYANAYTKLVEKELDMQSDDKGSVHLVFNRIFLLAEKK